ncbi:MAG: hypothetical protein QM669_13975 [Siphonobacter sp.]
MSLSSLRKNWPVVGWIFLLFLTVSPLLLLSLFNHPSAADDYCFAWYAREKGVLEATIIYYNGWSGRYFSNLLFHLTPLTLNWLWYFKVYPIMAISGSLASLYVFLKFFIRQSITTVFLIAAALFILYLLELSSYAESFYWITGSYPYLLPQLLTLFLVIALSRLYQSDTKKYLYFATIYLLIVIIIGTCEIFIILLTGLFGALIAYRLLFRGKLDFRLISFLVVSLICTYFVLESPGIKIRQAAEGGGGTLPFAVEMSVISLARYFIKWLPLLTVFSIFWVYWLKDRLPTAKLFNDLFRIRPWFGWLSWLGIVPFLFLPFFFGKGMDVAPARVVNVVYFYFLIGFFYNLTVSLLWLYEHKDLRIPMPSYLVMLAVATLPFLYLQNTNFRMVISDLKNGTAARYDQQLTERDEQIRQSQADTIYVEPLHSIPKTLFVEDIQEDPGFLWNDCQARFYYKKAIILKHTH